MPARAVRIAALLSTILGTALAQDLQNFQPVASTGGYFAVDRVRTTLNRLFTPSVWFNYAYNPVVRRDTEARVARSVVEHQTTVHLQGAYGLGTRFEVTAALPISYVTGEGLDSTGDAGLGAGDLRLGGKARLLGHSPGLERDQPFGMAFAMTATLPTGSADKLVGSNGLTFIPALIADFDGGPFAFAAQSGVRLRTETDQIENIEIGHALTWGLAGQVEAGSDFFLLIAELGGSVPLSEVLDEDVSLPVETFFGLRMDSEFGGLLTLGGGLGLNPDQGVPAFRILAGFGWRQPPARGPQIDPNALLSDTDEDGVLDLDDRCPKEPEDEDAFEDDDGCPDVDNDQDGIRDSLDRCPDEPELVNGYQDSDGCPDTGDADRDGIPDDRDRCADAPEDKDGYQDGDGCPDPDNDRDGVLDARDRCPDQPGSLGADGEGCPIEAAPEAPKPPRRKVRR